MYHQIKKGTGGYYSYLGSVRETTFESFYVHKDSINEYLLYSFNVYIGDTVRNLFTFVPEPGASSFIYDIIISGKDSILSVTGNYLNRIGFDVYRERNSTSSSWYYPPPGSESSFYVEKLGTGYGLLMNDVFISLSGGAAWAGHQCHYACRRGDQCIEIGPGLRRQAADVGL